MWGKELYFDATHVLADASLDSLTPRFAAEARAALHTHLVALFPDETAHEAQDSAAESAGAVPEVFAPAHTPAGRPSRTDTGGAGQGECCAA